MTERRKKNKKNIEAIFGKVNEGDEIKKTFDHFKSNARAHPAEHVRVKQTLRMSGGIISFRLLHYVNEKINVYVCLTNKLPNKKTSTHKLCHQLD